MFYYTFLRGRDVGTKRETPPGHLPLAGLPKTPRPSCSAACVCALSLPVPCLFSSAPLYEEVPLYLLPAGLILLSFMFHLTPSLMFPVEHIHLCRDPFWLPQPCPLVLSRAHGEVSFSMSLFSSSSCLCKGKNLLLPFMVSAQLEACRP